MIIINKTKMLLNTNKIIIDINSIKQVNKLIKIITVNFLKKNKIKEDNFYKRQCVYLHGSSKTFR